MSTSWALSMNDFTDAQPRAPSQRRAQTVTLINGHPDYRRALPPLCEHLVSTTTQNSTGYGLSLSPDVAPVEHRRLYEQPIHMKTHPGS